MVPKVAKLAIRCRIQCYWGAFRERSDDGRLVWLVVVSGLVVVVCCMCGRIVGELEVRTVFVTNIGVLVWRVWRWWRRRIRIKCGTSHRGILRVVILSWLE
jgi:hypothetical protein